MAKLPQKFIDKMNSFIEKYGFSASEDYLNELLEDSHLKESILDIQGFDTAERETFFEMLAQKLTGMSWPCNSDSDEVANEFSHKFINAVKNEPRFTILD